MARQMTVNHLLVGSIPIIYPKFMITRRGKPKRSKMVPRLTDGTNSRTKSGFSRDTTLGENKVMFPSMHNDTERKQMYPVSCPICGITHKFSETPNIEEGCKGIHASIAVVTLRQ